MQFNYHSAFFLHSKSTLLKIPLV